MQKTIKALVVWFVFAQTATAQSPHVKNWYLLFSAREASLRPFSLAGHAFVSWGIDSSASHKIALPLTLGFYPDENCGAAGEFSKKKLGRLVPGFLKNSNNRHDIITLIICTDSLNWAKTQAVAETWKNRNYNLLDRNCVRFMDDVAEAARLRTPRWRMLLGFPRRPTNYLRRLANKNRHDVFERTTHFFKKTAKSELILPPNIDLNAIRRAEKLTKNGKAISQ